MQMQQFTDQYYDGFRETFQRRLDEVAATFDIKSLLVMRSTPTHMVTAISAGPKQDTYRPGDAGPKSVVPGHHKLYCEDVVNSRKPLHVADAAADPEWKGNEDLVRFGLGTYYGLPVTAPDGEVLGTVCALHDQPYDFSDGLAEELERVRNEIERELREQRG